MHAFTPDGATLLVLDGFGLTRLVGAKQMKTERGVQGGLTARLSVSADGQRTLAWDDNTERLHWLSLPELKSLRRIERFRHRGAILHPDGQHLLHFAPSAWNAPTPHLTLLDPASDAHRTTDLGPLRDGSATATLGPSPRRSSRGRDLAAVSDEGWFAFFNAQRGTLYLGDVGDLQREARVAQTVTIVVSDGYRVALFPRRDDTWVVAHAPECERVFGARIDAEGRVTPFEHAGLALLSRASRDAFVVQTTEAEVVRHDLATGVTERFVLAPADHGVGEVCAKGSAVWMVPWHRETLVELVEARVVSRKLPAAEASLRAAATALVRRFNDWGRAVQCTVDVGELSRSTRGKMHSWRFPETPGDGSLVANLWGMSVYTWMSRSPSLEKISPHGRPWCVVMQPPTFLGTITVGDVEACFAFCDAHGLSFAPFADYLRDLYERRAFGGTLGEGEARVPAATHEAERMLVRGLLHHFTDATPDRLAPHQARWAETTLCADEVIAAVKGMRDGVWTVPGHALTTLARMTAVHLGAGAAPVLVALSIDAPEWFLNNSAYVVMATVRWLVEQYPETREAMRALAMARTDYRPHRWGEGSYGEDRRATLLAALG